MQRLLEITIPKNEYARVEQIIKNHDVIAIWHADFYEDIVLVRILMNPEKTESLLEELKKNFSKTKKFKVVVIGVEATIPLPNLDEMDRNKKKEEDTEEKRARKINRDELYENIRDSTKPSIINLLMIFLSSIVVTLGIHEDNTPTIIAGMIIAPMLGPHIGLALAVIIGDFQLGKKAFLSILMSLVIPIFISLAIGLIISANLESKQLLIRTKINLGDLFLAFTSGTAGALAFTTALGTSLTGVMIAVSLLPAIVTFGLMIGKQEFDLAIGALVLFSANIICINIAAILTFTLQGLTPNTWKDKKKSQKNIPIALITWILLLIVVFWYII